MKHHIRDCHVSTITILEQYCSTERPSNNGLPYLYLEPPRNAFFYVSTYINKHFFFYQI